MACRRRLGAEHILVLGTVQPKHYALLDPSKSLEQSVREAVGAGADAVVVTGTATGSAPLPERLERAKAAAGGCPIILGSGLDPSNAAELLRDCDGAIVGTSMKSEDFRRVEIERVRALVQASRKAL
jgi:predicted TIM-barrel enzyme